MTMTPHEELDSIYVQICEGDLDCDTATLDRIAVLEAIVNPKAIELEPGPEIIEGVCGNPGCNGYYCWECAAIRGGDPMDV